MEFYVQYVQIGKCIDHYNFHVFSEWEIAGFRVSVLVMIRFSYIRHQPCLFSTVVVCSYDKNGFVIKIKLLLALFAAWLCYYLCQYM